MKPGNVVIADIPGIVESKKRPAIVVSSDLYHADRPDLVLAIVSSRVDKATSKTDHIVQDWSEAGLVKPSFVRMFLYSVVATKAIPIGALSSPDWEEVQNRLQMSLEI